MPRSAKKFIIKTKNDFDVYVDMEHFHAATHLKDHPHLFDLLKKILPEYKILEDRVRLEVDTGKIVGTMDLVETQDEDDVFYAKRPNREKYTRFVRGKDSNPTAYITIELRKKNDREYEVFTAYIGRLTPSFPSGKDDKNEDRREFWKNHALVVGNQEIVPGTETRDCPW